MRSIKLGREHHRILMADAKNNKGGNVAHHGRKRVSLKPAMNCVAMVSDSPYLRASERICAITSVPKSCTSSITT